MKHYLILSVDIECEGYSLEQMDEFASKVMEKIESSLTSLDPKMNVTVSFSELGECE